MKVVQRIPDSRAGQHIAEYALELRDSAQDYCALLTVGKFNGIEIPATAHDTVGSLVRYYELLCLLSRLMERKGRTA